MNASSPPLFFSISPFFSLFSPSFLYFFPFFLTLVNAVAEFYSLNQQWSLLVYDFWSNLWFFNNCGRTRDGTSGKRFGVFSSKRSNWRNHYSVNRVGLSFFLNFIWREKNPWLQIFFSFGKINSGSEKWNGYLVQYDIRKRHQADHIKQFVTNDNLPFKRFDPSGIYNPPPLPQREITFLASPNAFIIFFSVLCSIFSFFFVKWW